MRIYDTLKVISESAEGISPRGLSERLRTALPNIYIYLIELEKKGLIIKNEWGRFRVNKTNTKLNQILDLQAISPDMFHYLITDSFKQILEKLGRSKTTKRNLFTISEIRQIEKIAVKLRIVLKISKRPTTYCLKLNETIVKLLLIYHDLEPKFNEIEFQQTIQELQIKKEMPQVKDEINDETVKILCEEAYRNNEDIKILEYAKTFVLDDRLTELLKKAELTNKEHTLFLNALDDTSRDAFSWRWHKQYIYNTNSIEGNTMTEKEIEDYLKQGKNKKVSKREIHETNNMSEAIQFLKLKRNEEISEQLINELHFMVQKSIAENPGKHKTFYNYIKPKTPTTPFGHVKERMRMLIEWYNQNKNKLEPFVLASIFHMQFEMIHPYPDGNGRVGRLIMNHILERENYLPLTITEKSKQVYYNALANRSIPQFLLYILSLFIEEYKK